MYGFTEFTCNVNYINDEMRKSLPPTDTRLRPDQRLMEEAKYDEAAEEKHRLEEKQRAVRKQNHNLGIEHKPRYFDHTRDPYSGEMIYVFNNKYWDIRKRMDYSDMPDLF